MKGAEIQKVEKNTFHRVSSRLYEVDFGSSSDSMDNIKARFALKLSQFVCEASNVLLWLPAGVLTLTLTLGNKYFPCPWYDFCLQSFLAEL